MHSLEARTKPEPRMRVADTGWGTYSLVQAPGEQGSSLLSPDRPHQVCIDGCCTPEHASQIHRAL